MNKIIIYISFLAIAGLGVIISACSEPTTYSQDTLWEMGTAVEPDIKILLPKTMEEGVHCSDYRQYTKGCLGGKRVLVRQVIMTLVEFETEEQAKAAAIATEQYYAKNWLLDDVTGEPVLEYFVKKALKAEKP